MPEQVQSEDSVRLVTICVALVALVVSSAAPTYAQPATRRAASPAALLAYPGFYQGQLVVVRGNLVTRDRPVLLSAAIERSIPLIFSGPSPVDGPIEVRASFWDVGRLQREDPRIVTLGLDRLLAGGLEGDWPRPGEIVALTVTDAQAVKPAEGAVTVRQIALDPSSYLGQRVKVTGQFRGRNLYGDVPQGPGLSQWDFVLRAADGAVWVTGLRPRGRGFNLDIGARVDTGTWLEIAGVVREGKGLVWIEGQQVAVTKPTIRDTKRRDPTDSADGAAARSDFQRSRRRRFRCIDESAGPASVFTRHEPGHLQGTRAVGLYDSRSSKGRAQHAAGIRAPS